MSPSDYRRIARDNLAGNWTQAILAALLAALLGGLITSSGINFNLNFEEDSFSFIELPRIIQMYLLAAASLASVLTLVQFIIGGVIRQGYAVYLLRQHDHRKPEIRDLFSQFDRFLDGFCLYLLESLFIALWSMLFVIPGVVAAYRYAMAPFILAENPDMTASEAINASKNMMLGRKADLFFLDLSFIGWALLNVLTLGIGSLWLNPYTNAAHAAFYCANKDGQGKIIDASM